MRVVLSGTTPQGRSEQFSTIVRVSSGQLSIGSHREQARFRAGVRGLGAPWRVDDEYEIARTYHEVTRSPITRDVSDVGVAACDRLGGLVAGSRAA